MKHPSLTIGIEEEYQIVDPESGELRSYITQSLKDDHRVLREFDFEPRMQQSIIEIGTKVCRTPAEAGDELVKIRQGVADLAAKNGLRILAAGTHPYSIPVTTRSDPFYQLAILDGARHRSKILSKRISSQFPKNGRAKSVRFLGRLHSSRRHACANALHARWAKYPVGCTAELVVSNYRIPHL
jgi:hypothetical protein